MFQRPERTKDLGNMTECLSKKFALFPFVLVAKWSDNLRIQNKE